MYKTCVQHDNLASESSSIAKSLQCVLTRSDVFTVPGPRNFQYLLVFDQTLCQNVTKVMNLIGCCLALFFFFNEVDIETQMYFLKV